MERLDQMGREEVEVFRDALDKGEIASRSLKRKRREYCLAREETKVDSNCSTTCKQSFK